MFCPLCNQNKYVQIISGLRSGLNKCNACDLIFVDPNSHLSLEAQKRRYELHHNSIEDPGYVAFLDQALSLSWKYINNHMQGLDYGCGPNPVLSQLLAKQEYICENYDPIFFDIELNPPYDFIFATECFEHFASPFAELSKIRSILNLGGILIVMTSLYEQHTDFDNWHYLRDTTHISFYSKNTFAYIAKQFSFEILEIGARVVILKAI